MTNPFERLDVSPSATDEEIKQAYLSKVREYPPERAPEQFQAVRDAYELVKTEKARLSYQLFHIQPPDLKSLVRDLLREAAPRRPDEALFKQMLAEVLARFRAEGNQS